MSADERRPAGLPEQTPESRSVYRDNGLQLITGLANPALADTVGKILKLEVDKPVTLFPDKERRVRVTHSLRRKDVVIIQSTSPPDVNAHIIELLLMIDAARRASADEITAVIPYFGYARQDRKDQPGAPISARMIADCIQTAGANRIVTFDIHADQLQGFASIPWETLYGSNVLVPRLKEEGLSDMANTVVLSPDMGGLKRARKNAEMLGTMLVAVVYKQRDIQLGGTKSLFMIGDVDKKDVVLVDDVFGSGGTAIDAACLAQQKGARNIYAAITHGLFLKDSEGRDALEKLEESPIKKLFVTDTVVQREEVLRHPKVEVVSIAPLIAEAIQKIHTGNSPNHAIFS